VVRLLLSRRPCRIDGLTVSVVKGVTAGNLLADSIKKATVPAAGPALRRRAHVAEEGGPSGIAAGGGVGVFFQRERYVHAGPRGQFGGAAGEVPGLEG
jgi:hypothetical protein